MDRNTALCRRAYYLQEREIKLFRLKDGRKLLVTLHRLSVNLKTKSMNKRRRNVLHLVLDDLERLRDPVMDREVALKIIQDAQIKVEQCVDEEEEALDNRPESFQFSAGNDSLSENISDLSEANDELEILIGQCQEMDTFNYELIRNDIIEIVNTIKRTIHR